MPHFREDPDSFHPGSPGRDCGRAHWGPGLAVHSLDEGPVPFLKLILSCEMQTTAPCGKSARNLVAPRAVQIFVGPMTQGPRGLTDITASEIVAVTAPATNDRSLALSMRSDCVTDLCQWNSFKHHRLLTRDSTAAWAGLSWEVLLVLEGLVQRLWLSAASARGPLSFRRPAGLAHWR